MSVSEVLLPPNFAGSHCRQETVTSRTKVAARGPLNAICYSKCRSLASLLSTSFTWNSARLFGAASEVN